MEKLPVDVAHRDVDAADDDYQVGDGMADAHLPHDREIDEGRRPDVEPPRAGPAVAYQVEAQDTPG